MFGLLAAVILLSVADEHDTVQMLAVASALCGVIVGLIVGIRTCATAPGRMLTGMTGLVVCGIAILAVAVSPQCSERNAVHQVVPDDDIDTLQPAERDTAEESSQSSERK